MPWQHKSFHEKSTSPEYPENSQGNPPELYGHGTGGLCLNSFFPEPAFLRVQNHNAKPPTSESSRYLYKTKNERVDTIPPLTPTCD